MGIAITNSVTDGLSTVLNRYFPDIPLVEEDEIQSSEKPCFFIRFLQAEQKQEYGSRYNRTLRFDVNFFPLEVKNIRALHDVAEVLYDKLELIEGDGNRYCGTGMKHEIANGVLHFFVDYSFKVWKQGPVEPKMQTMEQEGYISGR